MSSFSRLTRRAQVRYGFTEQDTYRDALGGAEPLHVFVTDGPLDAPGWMPAGSTRAPSKLPGDKPQATTIDRAGRYF